MKDFRAVGRRHGQRRVSGALAAARRSVTRKFANKGVLVLLYHRVAELARDPWSLCVLPAQFAQHLGVLKERTCPIRLSELGAHLGTHLFQRPRVAITFDDGYADNLRQAAPLLGDLGIPATVFVVSGAIRERREFWWDELERIVFEPDGIGGTRQLTLANRTIAWTIAEFGTAERDDWLAWKEETPTSAHRVYRELYGILSVLPSDERRALMDDFIRQARLSYAARPTHRALSCEEVRELAASSLIDIGVHTVSHPVLSSLPLAQQIKEIVEAKAELESLIGMPMRHFSYPYGKHEHYDRNTIEVVRRAGFEFAYVNEPGIAGPSIDRFQIPRVVVPALDGPEFAEWLTSCLATLAC